MQKQTWYGCRQPSNPTPSIISIATWFTSFSPYFIAGEFQFKIHWNFERFWPADTPNMEHKKLPRVVYRICQTHRDREKNGKNKESRRRVIVITLTKSRNTKERQGWLPFTVGSRTHMPYSPSFVASHQLKHYNVIIKMTNRITHDGKGSSRRS